METFDDEPGVLVLTVRSSCEIRAPISHAKNFEVSIDRTGLTRSAGFLIFFIVVHADGKVHVYEGPDDFNGCGSWPSQARSATLPQIPLVHAGRERTTMWQPCNSGFGADQEYVTGPSQDVSGRSPKIVKQRNGSVRICLRSPHTLTLTFTPSCCEWHGKRSPVAFLPRRVLHVSRGCPIARGVWCLLLPAWDPHLAASRFWRASFTGDIVKVAAERPSARASSAYWPRSVSQTCPCDV